MTWLIFIAGFSLVASIACAIWIALDESRHPQTMAIMNFVWPITALYSGPLAIWAYFAFGRNGTRDTGSHTAKADGQAFAVIAKGTTHCGAGCTLGDVIAEVMLAVVPGKLIVQRWRSVHFKKTDPDSILVLQFIQDGNRGGRIDLVHINVPGQDHAGVTKGWPTHYWKPLRRYLAKVRIHPSKRAQ